MDCRNSEARDELLVQCPQNWERFLPLHQWTGAGGEVYAGGVNLQLAGFTAFLPPYGLIFRELALGPSRIIAAARTDL
ncbi:hypothetical protein TI04_01225 [Achromatium sp. WMS2]|nr:hypothetical protein TI04_01225 [Achromatium sp. WMS2]